MKVLTAHRNVQYAQKLSEVTERFQFPGWIPCITHAGVMPVDPQVYTKAEGWLTLEVQRSKELYIKICILLRQHAKENSLGYIHTNGKSNSMPEIFGSKCMGCTIVQFPSYSSSPSKFTNSTQ